MKQYTIRQLQINKDWLKDLPIQIVKYNKVLAIISEAKEYNMLHNIIKPEQKVSQHPQEKLDSNPAPVKIKDEENFLIKDPPVSSLLLTPSPSEVATPKREWYDEPYVPKKSIERCDICGIPKEEVHLVEYLDGEGRTKKNMCNSCETKIPEDFRIKEVRHEYRFKSVECSRLRFC